MRNSFRKARMQIFESKAIGQIQARISLSVFWRHVSVLCMLSAAILLAGCPPTPQQQQTQTPQPPPASLVAADQALSSNLPDQAITDAQSYLRGNPHGSQASLAWYFEGRGYEAKVATDPTQMEQNLFQANSCYQQALNLNPPSGLEGDIRASLANVLYFQDKFADAIYQATNAMPLVSSQQVKSFLLLQIGESEQRLSRFSDADQTFRKIQRLYPNSPVAEAARDHEGQNKFYVQLATFDKPELADVAVSTLQSSGEVISKRTNATGLTIVDAGSYPSYKDAKAVKDRLMKNFPLAMIVP